MDRENQTDKEENQENEAEASRDPVVEKARELLGENRPEAAIRVLEDAIGAALPKYQSTETYEYRDFHSPMEAVLYQIYCQPEKEVRQTEDAVAGWYALWGEILLEQGRPIEAREPLEAALALNPVSFAVRDLYIRSFQAQEDLETYAELSRASVRFATGREDAARALQNLGWYYTEKGRYEEAEVCYSTALALLPGDAETAGKRNAVRHLAGREDRDYTEEELADLSEKYGIPQGADMQTLTAARYRGERYRQLGDRQAAAYFYGIYYDLTGDPDAGQILEELQEELRSGDPDEDDDLYED